MPRLDMSPPGADHQSHDRLSVVQLAFGDLSEAERPLAQALLDSCTECAALAGEVRLISMATARLPAPRRSRDFRLTQAQMQGARGSFLRSLAERLSAPRLGVLRPLGAAAMAIGFVLVVVGMGLPGISGTPVSGEPEVYTAAQPSATSDVDPGRAVNLDDTPPPESAGAQATPGIDESPVLGGDPGESFPTDAKSPGPARVRASPASGSAGGEVPPSDVGNGDGTAAPGVEASGGEEPSAPTSAEVDPDRPSTAPDPDIAFGEPRVEAGDGSGRADGATPTGALMVIAGLLLGILGLLVILLRVLSQRIGRDAAVR